MGVQHWLTQLTVAGFTCDGKSPGMWHIDVTKDGFVRQKVGELNKKARLSPGGLRITSERF